MYMYSWLELGSEIGGRANNTHSGGLGQSPSRVRGRAPAGSGAAPRRGPGQRPGGVRGSAPRRNFDDFRAFSQRFLESFPQSQPCPNHS